MWPEVLAENACKGLGKLGSLLFGKYFREHEYRDRLMRAQAERDARSIENGESMFDGDHLHTIVDLARIPGALLPRAIALEDEAQNLNATLAISANILKDVPPEDVSDEEVAPDWFTRWRREASGVSSPEMQQLWGRILVEEIKSPQTISLTTLDVLRNISKADAELFCKVARFRINEIIPSPGMNVGQYMLRHIISLQDAGLLRDSTTLTPLTLPTQDGKQYLECNGFVLILDLPSQTGTNILGTVISRAGKDILSIAETIPPATNDEINTIGDKVWQNLSTTCPGMTAYPLAGQGRLSHQELAHWPR